MEVVGTRSAMLLLRESYYGATRFDDFTQRVGIADAVASARLKDLVRAGLLENSPYREPGFHCRERASAPGRRRGSAVKGSRG